jgi:hypothetical protein
VRSEGILVRAAGAEVRVMGVARAQWSVDTFQALPEDVLGTEHAAASWWNDFYGKSELAVVASQPSTTVTIVWAAKGRIGSSVYDAGTSTTLDLGAYELLQAEAAEPGADLTGTRVETNLPVAVLSGHQCAAVGTGGGTGCDHLIEMLPPASRWGRRFVTSPFPRGVGGPGDIVRVIPQLPGTIVRVRSGATFASAQCYEAGTSLSLIRLRP